LSLILAKVNCVQRRTVSAEHHHRVSRYIHVSGLILIHMLTDGTLRWQAPEMMAGGDNRLTQEMDIYAFSICCIEILDKGTMPWQHQDDFSVVRFVLGSSGDFFIIFLYNMTRLHLEENRRPAVPHTRISTTTLTKLLCACWDRDPSLRPSFKNIAADLKQLRIRSGGNVEEPESPRPRPSELWEPTYSRPSPDMRPIPLPGASCEFGIHVIFIYSLTFSSNHRPWRCVRQSSKHRWIFPDRQE
jgi:hypothetical protein